MPGQIESSDVDALGEIMMIQGTMQRQFLRAMLRRVKPCPARFHHTSTALART